MIIKAQVEPKIWVEFDNQTKDYCDVCGQKLTRSTDGIVCNGRDYDKHKSFAKSVKTNEQWYPDIAMGSYYKLEDGILLFSPMLQGGSRAEEDGIVDFGFLEEEDECLSSGEKIVDHLNSIIINLLRKEEK